MADDWSQFPLADEQPTAPDPWAAYPMAEGYEAAPPPEQQPQQGLRLRAQDAWDKLKSVSAGEGIVGVGEAALTATTGLGSMVLGGLSAMNPAQPPADESVAREDYETGRPEFRFGADPTKTIESAQQAGTYQPRTEAGEAIANALSVPFEWWSDKAYEIASGLGDPIEHTKGAALTYAALMFLPAAFGGAFMRYAKGSGKTKLGFDSKRIASQPLRQAARDLYQRAEAAGGGVTAQSFAGVVARMRQELTKRGHLDANEPKTAAVIKRLEEMANQDHSLMIVEQLRRTINNARSGGGSDAVMAGRILDIYTQWMRNLKAKDMVTGDAATARIYGEAGQLWRRKFKADEIEWAIERARNKVEANYTDAGFQAALAQEFKAILNNKNRRKMFDDREIAAIRAVANGDMGTKALRLLGKFAPRGVISGAPGGLLMTQNPALGGAVWLIGEAARRTGDKMIIRRANQALEQVSQMP